MSLRVAGVQIGEAERDRDAPPALLLEAIGLHPGQGADQRGRWQTVFRRRRGLDDERLPEDEEDGAPEGRLLGEEEAGRDDPDRLGRSGQARR